MADILVKCITFNSDISAMVRCVCRVLFKQSMVLGLKCVWSVSKSILLIQGRLI